DWQELYDSLEITKYQPPAVPSKWGRATVVPRPPDAWLDDYEARTGFRLPFAYRDFMKVFGPGELADYRMPAPGYRLGGRGQDVQVFNQFVDLESFNAGPLHNPELVNKYVNDPERALRLVHFAVNLLNQDSYAWDPRETVDEQVHEYRIYVVIGDVVDERLQP